MASKSDNGIRVALGRSLLGLLIGAGALLAALLAWPLDRYIAWQQAEGTQMFHARWIYERIRFDRTPIDVAVIGSSRLEAGISPKVLSAELTRLAGERLAGERIGRPVQVANLSMVMPGRDFAWEVAAQLLHHHPEVRLIVLSDDGDVVNSHPLFRETAPAAEIIGAPVVVNSKYAENLLSLPYRNLANMARHWQPGWFGVAARFDPAHYAGPGLDRSEGYVLPDGSALNGDRTEPARAMERAIAEAVARQQAGLAKLAFLPEAQRLAVDRTYVARIAQAARARGVKLAFLGLPLFGPLQSPGGNPAFYRQYGPVISLHDLARDPALFQNGAHLNHAGAVRASQLAARRLAPLIMADHVEATDEGAP